MEHDEKVAALIVTWNRKDLLRRCLLALQGQTCPVHAIVVVDNASTDGTAEMLRADFPQVDVRRMEKNTGGAGGFHEAIRHALELPVDHLWLMDDDAWATPDALERLLRAGREIVPGPAFVCSRVIDDGDESVNIPTLVATTMDSSWDRYLHRGYLPIRSCSFVSALIPCEGARKAGLPLAHYFIWMDDAEYTLRLARENPGWYVSGSIVRHPRPSGQRVPDLKTETNPKRFPLYRHYYANLFETNVRHRDLFGWGWLNNYTRSVLRDLRHFIGKRQWNRLSILVKGVSEGILRGIRYMVCGRRQANSAP